jgi:hypothetical protein
MLLREQPIGHIPQIYLRSSVINWLSSLARRNKTSFAISSGSAYRPSGLKLQIEYDFVGMPAEAFFEKIASSGYLREGCTELTLIFRGAASYYRKLMIPTMACCWLRSIILAK